jgi:hypothetical protein
MENVGTFCAYLEYIMPIWYTLCSFVSFAVIWYIFTRFGILSQEKSGNPAPDTRNGFTS